MSKVRFVDSSIRVNSGGGEGGGSSISASYALSSSHSDFATSASYAEYAVSASHEIVKEVSSSYADTASLAQSGNGPFTGSFTGSFFGNGAGVFSGSFSGSIPDAFQIISGSVSASISPNSGLKINSGVEISLTSGSAFSVIEEDAEAAYTNRLDFAYDQQDPTLTITARSATSLLHLKTGGASTGTTYNSQGEITRNLGGTDYGVTIGTSFSPKVGNQMDLGFYNRRWKNLYINTGDKIGFGVNATPDIDLVSLRHTAGTNELVISGSSDVSLDVKGVVSASRFTVSSSADTTPGYTFWNNSTTGMLSNSPTNLKFQVDGTSSPELELNTGQAIFRTPVSFTDNEISGVSKIRNLGSISASGDFSSSITSTASFGTYLGDGSQLTGIETPVGAFGISDSSGSYTYYSSLSASMAAAVSGNVVEVFANTIVSGSDPLVDTILFKNGVNIFGNGYTYELNHSSSMAAFADYAAQNTTTGTDISCSINEFNIRRISSDASSKAILINNKTSGKQTSLNLHGSTIYSSEGITYNASYTYGTVDGGHFSGDTTGTGFQNNASSADTKPYVKNAHFHFPTGYSTVEYADNCQFIGETGTYALNATGRISNCYIYSKGSVSANAGGSNAALLGCHVENGSSGIAARGFYRISDSTIISSTGFAVRTFGNANCELTNNRIYASGYVALDQYTSYSTGKHIISNNLIITDSTTYAACQLKGAPTNDFLFSNNTIFNRGDNANSHGLKLTNNGSSHQVYMANNTIKVFNASANCITAAASADAHLADNIYDFASVPLNAFVTQSFTNVPDEQGNIHLTSSLNNNRIYSGSFSGSYVGDGSQLTGIETDPFPYSGSAIISSSGATASLTLEGSGSTVFDIIGSQGTLFSVDDDLSGTLFTANDVSGLPILEASASGEVYIGKSPQSLYTTAVISSTSNAVTQSIFGLSTSSYDSAFFDYTVQSGSNARAGSIMSVWSGSTINYTETTTTDIGNTTDFNLIVHISQSQAQIASHATNAGYKIKTIIRSI